MLAISSCGEEEKITVTPTFIEEPVFIESNELATAKVLEFLSYTDIGEITLRSDFPDTEVNEGLWTLEAASNYVDNVNFAEKSDVTTTYNLSITNIVDNGVINMSGADMVAKFDQLQADISAEESTNGKTAKIVDFKLNAVSAQQSDLEVGVVYGGENVDGCEGWPASEYIYFAAMLLEECLLDVISAQNSNYVWYQSVSITNPSSCYTYGGGGYMYEAVGVDMEPDEFDEAYAAAQELVTCVSEETFPSSSGGGVSYYGGVPTWIDITLTGTQASCCPNGFILCDEVVFGYGIAY